MLLFSVIAREFKASARKKQIHGLRLLFGGGLAVWFIVVAFRLLLGRTEAVGREVYDAIVWPLAYGLMLLAPALAAPSIATERREDTLGLLFLTNLRPWHIVIAKFTTRFVELLWFVLLAAPFFALPIWLGGVNHDEIVSDIIVLFGTAVLFTAAGICASVFFRNATAAFLVALAALFTVDVGFCMLVNRFVNHTGLLGSYEPGLGIFGASSLIVGTPSDFNWIEGGLWDLGLYGAVAFVILGLASWRIARLSHLAMVDAGVERTRRLRRLNTTGNWVAAILCVSLVPLVRQGWPSQPMFLHQLVVTWGPLLGWIGKLIALVLIARSVAVEKETGTLESLLCTPLSNAAIVNRKILETARRFWGWYLLLHAVNFLLLVYSLFEEPTAYVAIKRIVFLGFVADLAIMFSLGLFASSYAKNVAKATVLALLLAGIPLVLMNIVSLKNGSRGPMLRWGFYWELPDESLAPVLVCLVLAAIVYLFLIQNFRRFAAR